MLCLAFGSVLLLGVVVLPRFFHVVAFLGGPALLGPLLAAELLPMLRSALRGVVLAALLFRLNFLRTTCGLFAAASRLGIVFTLTLLKVLFVQGAAVCTSVAVFGIKLGLLLFAGIALLAGTLGPLVSIDGQLALAQFSVTVIGLTAHLFQAVRHRKTLIADLFIVCELLVIGSAGLGYFRTRSLALGHVHFRSVCGTYCTGRQQYGTEQFQACVHRLHFQVRAVSTTRRSSDRYSFDCISLRRETVRGNSCTSGPSVYSCSGGTAADRMSLTRRS